MAKNKNKIKLLADVNIEKQIIFQLIKNGFDVKSIIEIDKHLEDVDVLKLAKEQKRILLTNDKDFGEIVYRQKLTANGIILLRFKGQNEMEKAQILVGLLKEQKLNFSGKFTVVTKEKIRIISL